MIIHLRATPRIERAAPELWAERDPAYLPRGTYARTDPQEHEVAVLPASGLTNRQIAARLDISHRTVGRHLYRVFPKLDVATAPA